MTTIRIEKVYLDNMINYVEKLETYAGELENDKRVLLDKIEHLERKVSNIKRNKLRLKNKYQTLLEETRNTVDEKNEAPREELDWIEIDELNE